MRPLLVALTVLLALAAFGCGGEDEKDAYEVRVEWMSESGELPIESGAPVRIADEEVGEVGAIEPGTRGTEVTRITTLLIEDDAAAPLPADSTFRIASGGVEIKRGTFRETAREGATFSYKQTYAVP